MNGSLTLATMTLGVLMVPICSACPVPVQPKADFEYKTIVLAEVVGVHLTDYTGARLDQIKEARAYTWPMDTDPGYEVHLIPFETFKGSTGKTMSIRVAAGCGVPTPDLNQFGLFYVSETGEAVVVLQNHNEYRNRLEKLGSRYSAKCETRERFALHPCWKPLEGRLECLNLIKSIAFISHVSCPAGARELYERIKDVSVKPYGWELPPLSIQ